MVFGSFELAVDSVSVSELFAGDVGVGNSPAYFSCCGLFVNLVTFGIMELNSRFKSISLIPLNLTEVAIIGIGEVKSQWITLWDRAEVKEDLWTIPFNSDAVISPAGETGDTGA